MKHILTLCLSLIITGQALSQLQTLNLSPANGGTGDNLRAGGIKINANFSYLDGLIDDNAERIDSLIDAGVGGGSWGAITGTLTNQTDLNNALGLKANLASPTFTGTPAAPTAASGTNTTQIATTAFVQDASLAIHNSQSDSYTLTLSDWNKIVDLNKATAVTLTVPPNSSVAFPTGTVIYVRRSGAGTLTFAEGSGVTITSSSGGLADAGLNVVMSLIKTGTNTWLLQNGGPGSWQAWTPIFTGFSVDPVGTARYTLVGKTCHVYFTPSSDGTSNATTFTMTLPFSAANTVSQQAIQIIMNSGALAVGRVVTTANSNVLTINATVAGGAFTASGTKGIRLAFTYEIQ